MKARFILLALPLIACYAFAAGLSTDDRIAQLEKQVKTLQDKIDKMESTLMRGGGFMIVANFTCDLSAMGKIYTGTELSERAARDSAIALCKQDHPTDGLCIDSRITCKK